MEIKNNKTIKNFTLLSLLTLCTLALLQPGLAGAMEKNEVVALINKFDKEIDDRLLAAAKKGDINGVKDAIKDDANVNAKKEGWGKTPLHYAAKKGHLEIVRLLTEKGATINVTDEYSETPLHKAAENGHLEIAKLLIAKDATINVTDEDGETPLHKAAENGHLEVVRFLIEKGANINAETGQGKTPLYLAARWGNHLEIVRLLIEKGATIDAKTKKNKTPLHLAASNGKLEVVAYLTLAQDLLNAAKNPDTFDTFANTYLNLNDTKKIEQNLTDTVGIIASRIAMMDKECIKKLFNWMKQHKRLLFKRNQDNDEIFEPKWFYLDLAYQTDIAAPHTKIALLKKCFDYLETTTNSVFNTAVQEYIERKGLWTCCDQNMYTKKQLEERQKTWDTLAKERSKMIDQNKLLASTTYTKKLIIPKKLPTVAMFAANQIVTKPEEQFTDVDFGFKN